MKKSKISKSCGDRNLIEVVTRHIERYIGPVHFVFHEKVSKLVHIDIHLVAPTRARPYHTLVTSGMCQRRMNPPAGYENHAYAELFLKLPPEWRLDGGALRQELWRWPVRELSHLARFPHEWSTWLGCGHTVQHYDPPQPYAESTGFCATVLTHPITASLGFSQMKFRGRDVQFYQVLPLYKEELGFARERTSQALLERFARSRTSDIIDVNRRNLCAPDGGTSH